MATPEVAHIPRRAHLALFEATTLTAKGVKDQLVARGFPVASLRLFTSDSDPDSNLTEFAGEAMLVSAPDFDALGRLDIAFLCGAPHAGKLYLEWPVRAGFVAIDLSGASSAGSGIVPVNALVNPEAIHDGPGVVTTPRPIALMLSTLLGPLIRQCGLKEAVAVVLKPASELGTPGIDELYQQALSLMNFGEMPKDIFGRQLAFNLIPGFLPGKGPGSPASDVEREVRRIIGDDVAFSLQVIQAPVFHGHAAMIHLLLAPGMGRHELISAFKSLDQVTVLPGEDKATPVERAGESGILVSGVRPGAVPGSYWLWAVGDDLAGGSSLNAVRIAEILLERGLGRPEA